MTEEPWVELGETIRAIREQLQAAIVEGEDLPLKFRSGPVELEFFVEVRKEAGASAKVFVIPWTLGAKAGANSGRSHRMKITLQPVDERGRDKEIGRQVGERPY